MKLPAFVSRIFDFESDRKALVALLSRLVGVQPQFWILLEPILVNSGKTFLADAVQAALPLVTDLEAAQIPSVEKRAQAVLSLVAALAKNGKQLEQSIASLAVELALQQVRAVVPAPVTAPPVDSNAGTEWQAGVNIARRGDQLPDLASDSARAGFASVPLSERGKYDANGNPKAAA